MCTQKLKRMMIDSGVWGTFWQSHGRSNFPIRTHHVFVMFTCALTKQNHWIIGVTQGRWTVSSAICSPFSRSFTIGFPHLFVARWSWSRTLLGYPEERLHIGKWACASSVPCKLLSLSHGVSSLGVAVPARSTMIYRFILNFADQPAKSYSVKTDLHSFGYEAERYMRWGRLIPDCTCVILGDLGLVAVAINWLNLGFKDVASLLRTPLHHSNVWANNDDYMPCCFCF